MRFAILIEKLFTIDCKDKDEAYLTALDLVNTDTPLTDITVDEIVDINDEPVVH